MIDEKIIKQFVAFILISILVVFAYLIVKPIFFSIILGFILAYSFNPINKQLLKKIKNKTLSAVITCFVSMGIIGTLIWFLIPALITQVFEAYISIQALDVVGFFRDTFPFLFTTPQISANVEAAYNTFISTTANVTLQKFTEFIIDLPAFLLKLFVVLIAFFYGIRDGDKMLNVLRESLPFNKSLTNRFIKKSKQVTFSVIFGRVVVGIATGILTGLGFYAVGVKSALLLTVIAVIASIVPIVGPWVVWIPVVVTLFLTDKFFAGLFLLLYGGVVINLFENIIHPVFVSKTAKIPTSLTLIGVIGGLLVFGILGIIIGPLIMAYIVVLSEIYREKKPTID